MTMPAHFHQQEFVLARLQKAQCYRAGSQ